MNRILNKDVIDLLFRGLFCSIFLGLGSEHMIDDRLIQRLMPAWAPEPQLISAGCGIILITGGALILIGYKIRFAATMLSCFLIAVTILVHGPALMRYPDFVSDDHHWLWDILQRSNFVKNLCLLGVCLRLMNYELGRWSCDSFISRKSISSKTS